MTIASHKPPDDELIAFAVGTLPDARARSLEQYAANDAELASEIAVLRLMTGVSVDPDQPLECAPQDRSKRVAARTARTISWQKSAAAVLFILGAAGLGWAGWQILTAPLLEDTFSDGWYDAKLWQAPPGGIDKAGVREEKGYLRLLNRGYLVTRDEFRGAISVQVRWKWIDLTTNPHYADHLAVGLRTCGKPLRDWPHELSDGIVVRFNAWSGSVSIDAGANTRILAQTEPAVVPMPADAWHDLRITDNGETISVFMAGQAIDPKYATTPVLQCQCKERFPNHHVAVFNREWVAFPHESYLDWVRIERLGKGK